MKVAKYLLYFTLMLILANTLILDGIRPFDIGLYIGLVYAGENLAILTPLFILANIIANPSIDTLILTLSSSALMVGLYFLSVKLKRRVGIIELNIVSLLSRLPIILMSINDSVKMTDNLVATIISQIFTYVSLISLYAIIKRGWRNKLTQDEMVASGILLIVFAAGFYNINIFGFFPVYILAGFVVIMLIYNNSPYAIIISSLIGVGIAISSGDIAIASSIVICAICAMMFKRMPIAFIAVAYVLADIGIGIYFRAFGQYNVLHFIAVTVGVLIAVVMPPFVHERVRQELRTIRKGLSARAIINMNRNELSSEIMCVSKAFRDIERVLKAENTMYDNKEEEIQLIKREIIKRVCANCERKRQCYNENGDIDDLFDTIVEGAIEKGKATLVDVPPLLTSICKKINLLLHTTTQLIKEYEKNLDYSRGIDGSKLLLAEQTSGISILMSDLAKKINRKVIADESYEKNLIYDMAYRNVVCSEVLIWNEEEKGITLVVRQSDKDKKVIDKTLYKRTGIKWLRSDINNDYNNGMCAVTFLPAPQYDILIGECMSTKTGSIISGDTRSKMEIGKNKIMIALCDGMGSGESAEKSSNTAMTMVENLYLAGFDSDTILNLSNNLLSNTNKETFSALDISIVDIDSGWVDFIKLGAVDSFIRVENGIEIAQGGALPLGIVEEMKPKVMRKRLKPGELCLIVSDGVIDTISNEEISNILLSNSTLNPQVVCNEIIKACLYKGLKDDITAIAYRLYTRI